MKYKVEVLGETILLSNLVHIGRVVKEGNRWFFNALLISGVGVSLFSESKDEADIARKKLINAKIENDKKFLQKHRR